MNMSPILSAGTLTPNFTQTITNARIESLTAFRGTTHPIENIQTKLPNTWSAITAMKEQRATPTTVRSLNGLCTYSDILSLNKRTNARAVKWRMGKKGASHPTGVKYQTMSSAANTPAVTFQFIRPTTWLRDPLTKAAIAPAGINSRPNTAG